MKFDRISEKFHNNGALLINNDKGHINQLNRDEIINVFEKTGLIVFRGFNLNPDKILETTDIYTKTYAADAPRRQQMYGKKNLNTVDEGFHEMPLHSEASYSPSWPEILWFYCVQPSLKGGTTTLCDGIMLWKKLPNNIKDFFLSNPIVYNLEFPVIKKKKGYGEKEWPMNTLGSSHGILDYENGLLKIKQTRFAVAETRLENLLTFTNHLMIIFKNEPQIKSLNLVNGEKIPQKIIDEVKNISNNLIYDLDWQTNDLIMLDNRRFMHGRRAYKKDQKREIINIQTLKANFSFGSTIRNI